MNHKYVYNQLIENAQRRNWTKKSANCYVELHHIKPKSIYPDLKKEPSNLVYLTAREHFIAHLLLAKIYGGPMITAVHMMMYENNKKYISRKYAWIKELFIIQNRKPKTKQHQEKITNALKGKKHTKETKQKIGEKSKGRKHTIEVKNQQRNRMLGNKINLGRKQSEYIILQKSKSIVCLNNNQIFKSIKDAADTLGLNRGDISNMLNGRQKTVKGYCFSFTTK